MSGPIDAPSVYAHDPLDWEDAMPATANLDAMIRRADFEGASDHAIPDASRITTEWPLSLVQNFHSIFRKPDFQRDTAS